MTDEAAILAAVLAHPDEDTPRLLYADCLQERGDEARAEFIRVQIELAYPTFGPDGTADTARRYYLVRREVALLADHWREWSPVCPAYCAPGRYAPAHDNADKGVNVYFGRGFVHQVACPLRDWLWFAATAISREPVRQVVLTAIDRDSLRNVSRRFDERFGRGASKGRLLSDVAAGVWPGIEVEFQSSLFPLRPLREWRPNGRFIGPPSRSDRASTDS